MKACVYGSPKDPERDKRRREETFKYLEARINAEKINPQDDYDSERYIALLQDIARCECDTHDRNRLIRILDNE